MNDTCCYSNFALIGRYDVLETLYGSSLTVTALVAKEMRDGAATLPKLQVGLDAIEAGRLQVIDDIDEAELGIMQELPNKFSAADKSILAVAARRGWILMTDEKALLRECGRRTISTLSTEDVLRAAVQAGILKAQDLPAIAEAMEREASFKPRI